jgi:hypothetical protein
MVEEDRGPSPALQQRQSSMSSTSSSTRPDSGEVSRPRHEHSLYSLRVVLPLVAVLVIIVVVCSAVGATARGS